MYDSTAFAEPATWVSRLTLLAIVLGIDNIIFIAILVGRLPWAQQGRGRTVGRLLSISWIIGLRAVLFTLDVPWQEAPFGVSGRDLILLAGGCF